MRCLCPPPAAGGPEATSDFVAPRAQGLLFRMVADMDYQFFGDQEQQLHEVTKVTARHQRNRVVGCFLIAACFVLGLTAPIVILALI